MITGFMFFTSHYFVYLPSLSPKGCDSLMMSLCFQPYLLLYFVTHFAKSIGSFERYQLLIAFLKPLPQPYLLLSSFCFFSLDANLINRMKCRVDAQIFPRILYASWRNSLLVVCLQQTARANTKVSGF